MLSAMLLVVLPTLALPQHGDIRWPAAVPAVAALTATWVASLLPVCWPLLSRIGGVLITLEVLWLVASTGGAQSPYRVFYVMLLAYAAVFYGTRRLVLTCAVVAVLAAAPYVWSSAPELAAERTDLVVTLAIWLGLTAMVHGLVRELRARTRQVHEQQQWFSSLYEQNPDAVYSLDSSGRVTSANAAAGRLLGRTPEELMGEPIDAFVPEEDAAAATACLTDCLTTALDERARSFESSFVDRRGHSVAVAVSYLPIVVDGAVVGVYGVAKDVSEAKALQQRLARQALHDPLTGLANRTLLADRLEHALAGGERTGLRLCVLVLDLDGFKQVNDELGHGAGDELLVEVAVRLGRCVRRGDTLARLGGDEFALVLPDTPASDATTVAERILAELAAPAVVAGQPVPLAASVGVACGEAAGLTPEELLRRADQAMYAAKRAGKGRYELFRPGLDVSPAAFRATVSPDDARAWAAYMRALRAEVAEQKRVGALPAATRSPASAHRTLEQLLTAIEELPHEPALAELTAPDGPALQEFLFHQTAVHHWADALADDGIVTVRRRPAADRFWGQFTDDVTRDVVAEAGRSQ
jgi:diguanylate cyclase (GGDEF)-like protein/PAS domain S-box-containing protein